MLLHKMRIFGGPIRSATRLLQHMGVGLLTTLLTLGVTAGSNAAPAQYPLFLSNPVKPIMVLNMSKDHQLFFKLYDDYSDIIDRREYLPSASSAGASSGASSSSRTLNPNFGKSGSDGIADTTYVHQYRYYGYFDSDKCYTYADGVFSPNRFVDSTRYCNYAGRSDEWSGNLLNWATMTRLDAVRKILYGGKRFRDSENETILERSFIPEDAHAFAKHYNGLDIHQLTPFGTSVVTGGSNLSDSGITFCNATSPPDTDRNKQSQVVSADEKIPPLLKVAKGNFALWASNEGYQCRWGQGTNDNNPEKTKLQSNPASPTATDQLGDYAVRVKVCVSRDLINDANEEGCKEYASNKFKPIGLLQEYGENNAIHFGLITGSYLKNKSGGVLRKNVGSMTDEINLGTGQFFESNSTRDSIIRTLDLLTIAGYDYSTGQYNTTDSCRWGLSRFDDGQCTNWGNPQSEIYLESMRYFAGLNPSFAVNDSTKVPNLRTAQWTKPVTTANYCAPLNILQFNASTNSYDVDQLSGADSTVGVSDLAGTLNRMGTAEGISGNYFVGVAGTGNDLDNELCTPKRITNLSDVKGTCPDAPRLSGGYHIAALAHSARKTGIPVAGLPNEINGKRDVNSPRVHTYAVALAPAVPKVEIPVPGDSTETRKVTILPACRNTTTDPDANCAIVDFKIISQNHAGSAYTGSLYVNWEDSEQGGDYDQDMWGLINYTVTGTSVTVKTKVFAQATDHALGFGYVIGGTTNDGFHVQSGINNFVYGEYCKNEAGKKCTCLNAGWKGACTDTEFDERPPFTIAAADTDTVKLLDPPLKYAAKWGGYANDNASDAQIAAGATSNYYYATDPRHLAASLRDAFENISARDGSSSGVATNSTSLNESTYLYQAIFNSSNWSGSLNAFAFDTNGRLVRSANATSYTPTKTTDNTQPNPASRTIYTYNGTSTVPFQWNNLTAAQQNFLKAPGETNDTNARKRLNWLRGSAADEATANASGVDKLRSRGTDDARNIYADIVNSTPVYVGATNYRYGRLPIGGSSYAGYVRAKKGKAPKIVVGANDGKLHVFDANTLQETYAYVPNMVFPKLRNVTAQNYGKRSNPHQYIVDGPLTVSDVYDSANGRWRTVVVGTLGGGGRGVFALDVTENTPRVLFELTDSAFPQLGYVLGKPIIAPMADGKWAAIFGNGASSGGPGVAAASSLFIVNIFDSANVKTILSTGAGTGLSAPAVLPDANGVAKTIYAGDLSGRMWKFNVEASSRSAWSSTLLYHAKTSDGKNQPITAAPTLGVNSSKEGKIAVYFGTGKYFEEGDHEISASNPYHSIYAITDSGRTVEKGSLAAKTISSPHDTTKLRTVSSPVIDWSSMDGWRLDFGADEERVVAKPLLIADKLVFATIVPSPIACDYGGSSWLVEIPAVGDKFRSFTVLKTPQGKTQMSTAEIGFGLTKEAASIVMGDIVGQPKEFEAQEAPKMTGRQSWRELD